MSTATKRVRRIGDGLGKRQQGDTLYVSPQELDVLVQRRDANQRRPIVPDGHSVHRPLTMMDSQPQRQRFHDVAAADGSDNGLRRPGFRHVAELGTGDSADTFAHTASRGRQAMYDAYDAAKAKEYLTGAGTHAMRPAAEGSICMTNDKEPGHIRNGVCVADDDRSATDSRSCQTCGGSGDCQDCDGSGVIDEPDDKFDRIVERTQNATERTRRTDSLRDAEYAKYDEMLRNAWRR